MSPSKALANLLLANDSTLCVTHVPGLICYLCARFVPANGLTGRFTRTVCKPACARLQTAGDRQRYAASRTDQPSEETEEMRQSISWTACLLLVVVVTISCTTYRPPPPSDPTAFVCFQTRMPSASSRTSASKSADGYVIVVDEKNGLGVALPRRTTLPSCASGTGGPPTAADLPSGHACAGNSSISAAMDHCFTVCSAGVTCTSSNGFWSCKCD